MLTRAKLFLTAFATLSVMSMSLKTSLLANSLDFTKGGKPTSKVKWNLGPTGIIGWPNQKVTKQIYIWEAAQGSPASGKVSQGDVILGIVSPITKEITKGIFQGDPRKQLSAAITEAEKKENGGKLVLNIWSKGRTKHVAISLKVMGTYSETAPRNCPKTDKIIEMLCKSIEKKVHKQPAISRTLDMLGLLATGEKKYLPMIKSFASVVTASSKKSKPRLPSWRWAYHNLFLSEYYLATGDKSVLPGIELLTKRLVDGQTLAGTWGHGFAKRQTSEETGRVVISLGGYGTINAVALPCAMSLELASKCGAKVPGLKTALSRSRKFFGYYAGKGTIPYGDHMPRLRYDSNGKSSAAAILFQLAGNAQAAEFFSRMTLASSDNREGGHTGNYWSFLWGGLGASMTGDESLTQFLKDIRWYHELERRWDGDLQYQGTMKHHYLGNRVDGRSARGARLLYLCAPRKNLYINGKGGLIAPALTGKTLADAARPKTNASASSPDALLKDLSSWSPVLREESASKLGKLTDFNAVKPLIAMLKSNEPHKKYGACQGLRYAGRANPEAAKLLIDIGLKSDDPILQYFALQAFLKAGKKDTLGMDKAAAAGIVDFLKFAKDLQVNDQIAVQVAKVINSSKAVKGLKGNRELLVAALLNILKSNHGQARAEITKAVYPVLTAKELEQIWGEVFIATVEKAPSGNMDEQKARIEGIKLMAKYGVKEGIRYGAEFSVRPDYNANATIPPAMGAMQNYGSAAKDFIPMMKEKAKNHKARARLRKLLEKMEKTKPPKLISIKPQIEKALKKSN